MKRRKNPPHVQELFGAIKPPGGYLSKHQWVVYDTLLNKGNLTAREMGEILGVQRDTVTPTLSVLADKGAVIRFEVDICHVTGNKAYRWKAFPGWQMKEIQE